MSKVDQKSLPNHEVLRNFKNNSNTVTKLFRIRFQAEFVEVYQNFIELLGTKR